jgi:hypothetical protein
MPWPSAFGASLKMFWSTAMIANVAAIPALANRVAEAIYERVASGAIEAIDLVCPRSAAARHGNRPPLVAAARSSAVRGLGARDSSAHHDAT